MDDEDDGDYVNLAGVFTRPPSEQVGVRLDSRNPDWATLRTVIIPTGHHTKLLIKGAWHCVNTRCAMRWAMIEGDAFLIMNDGWTVHYRENRLCLGCGKDCNIAPVAVFVEYITEKALDELRVRMQRQAPRSQQRKRAVAEVHVLASTGEEQPVPASAHPGRVLGPDGQLPEWFYTGVEAPEE